MPSLSRWWLPAVALIGGVVGAGAMWGVDRARGGAVGPQVREYLLTHPEVIPEAMTRLQDRENGRLVAQHRRAIVQPYGSAWAGNPRGDVTVVEYLDYNCGYCRATLPVVAQLIARDPQVRVVYRELPVLAESSRAAARASLAAAAQGRHARFHAALYAGGPVTPASIAAASRTAGIDPARVPSDAQTELDRNLEVARALGFSGTPSWVIGDRILSGAQPLEALEAAVKAARGG
jgi:protein-disulfide isomerase